MQVTLKTLPLTLNKKWFNMIKAKIKPEEYREIKPYWIKRLCKPEYHNSTPAELDYLSNFIGEEIFKEFGGISANNGYQKDCPNIKWEHKGIRIGTGNPEWGAEPGKKYFVLGIGELINN